MTHLFTCFLSFTLLLTSLFGSDKEIIEKAYAYLDIGDYLSAASELKVALTCRPDSKDLRKALIKVFSESADDMAAIQLWKESSNLFEDFSSDVKTIETISWGVLKKSKLTSLKSVKNSALVGAAATQDIRAVYFLKEALCQSDATLRLIAARLSSRFGDKLLIDTMKSVLKHEKVWYVRLELIKSLASLRCQDIAEDLQELLSSSQTTYEEKVVAIQSLLLLYDNITEEQLHKLIKSKRSGHRLFACQIISYLNKHLDIQEIETLLNDPSFEVQGAILMALATLKLSDREKEDLLDPLEKLENAKHDFVKMNTLWLRTLLGNQASLKKLQSFVFAVNPEIRRLAAAFLGRTGSIGEELALETMSKSCDPYVKINICLGLTGVSDKTKQIRQLIHKFLAETDHEKIMWQFYMSQNFKMISPSLIRHIPEMMDYPALIDSQTRLSLLNILAVLRDPRAEDAIKQYLKSKHLGSTFFASRALLEEGSLEAEESIKKLLSHPDRHVRVQAGLVLAFYGEDENAFEVLKEAYGEVDKELKAQILEALGQLGSKKAIPFLTNLLDDPFNTNRMLAASAIIQCVNH